jgi:hypothetical protein
MQSFELNISFCNIILFKKEHLKISGRSFLEAGYFNMFQWTKFAKKSVFLFIPYINCEKVGISDRFMHIDHEKQVENENKCSFIFCVSAKCDIYMTRAEPQKFE